MTSGAFSFAIEVRWHNSANEVIGASGWTEVTGSVVAPPATNRANVRMVVGSLNGTIYADDFLFKP